MKIIEAILGALIIMIGACWSLAILGGDRHRLRMRVLHIDVIEMGRCENIKEYWKLMKRKYEEQDLLLRHRTSLFAAKLLKEPVATFTTSEDRIYRTIMDGDTVLGVSEEKELSFSRRFPFVHRIVLNRAISISFIKRSGEVFLARLPDPPKDLVTDIRSMEKIKSGIY
ncbi:MAG TPA: hypothetical protein VMA75_04150 [Candidatus Paceibacterota bacterium]|nr:hypothetical protein [Candidatus Paceibacterota bacterium]